MTRNESGRGFSLIRWLRKFTVSAFVICTFLAYALHERVMNPISAALSNSPSAVGAAGQASAAPTTPSFVLAPAPPTQQPSSNSNNRSAVTTATAIAHGKYRDGQYMGSSVNVFWGTMQVKAIIQNGKLANVQVLQFPGDRRTSQRINEQALPMLTDEVMQAQNANVDFISGATLTSEGYLQSLQDALASAHS